MGTTHFVSDRRGSQRKANENLERGKCEDDIMSANFNNAKPNKYKKGNDIKMTFMTVIYMNADDR